MQGRKEEEKAKCFYIVTQQTPDNVSAKQYTVISILYSAPHSPPHFIPTPLKSPDPQPLMCPASEPKSNLKPLKSEATTTLSKTKPSINA